MSIMFSLIYDIFQIKIRQIYTVREERVKKLRKKFLYQFGTIFYIILKNESE